MMAATDNLASLYNHEEQLRASSLATITADAALSDHWNLVAEAMNAIWAFTHDHVHGSEDELALQLLGIRLFNAAGASIKLALSGYYQKAFDQVRDLIETSFLVDYLSTYPAEIDEWRRADQKKRMSQFGAARIRSALDMAQVGPFFDEQKLRSWLGEMAMRLSHAAMLLLPNPDGSDMKLLVTQAHYLGVVDKWWSKYRGMKPQAVP